MRWRASRQRARHIKNGSPSEVHFPTVLQTLPRIVGVTSDVVLDSLRLAKWVLPEVESDRLLRLAAEVSASGHRLIVLELALIEVTNAIWKRVHRREITPDEGRRFVDELATLPVVLAESKPLLRSAYELAVSHHIAIYDALFVALTIDLNIVGITTDEPLVTAVKSDYPHVHLFCEWPITPP